MGNWGFFDPDELRLFGPIWYLGDMNGCLWCLNSTGFSLWTELLFIWLNQFGWWNIKKLIWEVFSDVFGVNSPSTGFFVAGFLRSTCNLNSENSHRRHEPTIFVLTLPSSFQGQPDHQRKDLTYKFKIPGTLNNHFFTLLFQLDDEPNLYMGNCCFSISIHVQLAVWGSK